MQDTRPLSGFVSDQDPWDLFWTAKDQERGAEADLSFPGDGLVEEQIAGLSLVYAVVGRGAAEGLGAVGRQRRRRGGRVGLVAGGTPAPVAAAAAAGRGATLLPGSAEALCKPDNQRQRARAPGVQGWERLRTDPDPAKHLQPTQKCATARGAVSTPQEKKSCIMLCKH